jgi:hypothetical protein
MTNTIGFVDEKILAKVPKTIENRLLRVYTKNQSFYFGRQYCWPF